MTQVGPYPSEPPRKPAQETAESAQETAQSAQETAESAQKTSQSAQESASEPAQAQDPKSVAGSTPTEEPPESPPTEEPPAEESEEENKEQESSDDPQRADRPQGADQSEESSDEGPIKARFGPAAPEPRVVMSEDERAAAEHLARVQHNERTGGGEVNEGELQAAREEHLRRTAGVSS